MHSGDSFLMRPVFDFRHLRSFVVLAETLNYRLASERLGLAQPALTRQIQELEDALGCSLIARSSRGSSLTDEGRRLLPRAIQMLRLAWEITDSMRLGALDETVIRLGVTELVLERLQPFLRHFRDEQEAIRLKLSLGCTEELSSLLHRGIIDAAILHPPIHMANLSLCMLYEEPLVLAGTGSARTSEKLNRLIMIPKGSGPRLHETLSQISASRFGGDPLGDESEEFSTRLSMVLAGLGWSVFPKWMVDKHPELCQERHEMLPTLKTALAFRQDFDLPALSELQTALENHLSRYPDDIAAYRETISP